MARTREQMLADLERVSVRAEVPVVNPELTASELERHHTVIVAGTLEAAERRRGRGRPRSVLFGFQRVAPVEGVEAPYPHKPYGELFRTPVRSDVEVAMRYCQERLGLSGVDLEPVCLTCRCQLVHRPMAARRAGAGGVVGKFGLANDHVRMEPGHVVGIRNRRDGAFVFYAGRVAY